MKNLNKKSDYRIIYENAQLKIVTYVIRSVTPSEVDIEVRGRLHQGVYSIKVEEAYGKCAKFNCEITEVIKDKLEGDGICEKCYNPTCKFHQEFALL